MRLGDFLEALREANQKILYFIRLPQIKYVTQFRVAQIFDNGKTSSNNPNDTMKKQITNKNPFSGTIDSKAGCQIASNPVDVISRGDGTQSL